MDHGYGECFYGGQGFVNVPASWLVDVFGVICVMNSTIEHY
jgi:hypothetical protein